MLLPPEEKRRVPAVWDRVDEGAGFDEVLDALISDGLRDLSGFALASVRDGDARVVIRGPVTAVLTTDDGEEVRVEGAAAATWVEREVRHVVALRVAVDGEPAADEAPYLLRDGLARAGEVREPVSDVVEPGPRSRRPVASAAGRTPEEPAARGAAPRSRAARDRAIDDAARTRGTRRPAGALPRRGRRRRPAGRPRPGPPPGRLRRRRAAAGGAAEPVARDLRDPPRGAPRHRVRRRGPRSPPTSGSTNGTVVVQPGMPPEELAAGVPTPLLPGAVLDLGDGISIEVVEP